MQIFVREKPFYKRFFPLLLVIALQSLAALMVNMVDNLMLGRYTELALSGATLVNQLQFMLQQIAAGTGTGIVVLASAVLSVLAGKAMDRFGKEKFYYPVAAMQVLGGLIAYSIKFAGHAMPLLCVGGTCIMAGNLAMAGLFTASSRDYTPAGRAGASQSVKMVIYIMLPMVLASIIDPLIIRAVALEPTAEVLAKYPSYAGSYLYPYELFLAAAVSAVFILIPAYFVRRDADRIRREKLAALEK